MIMRICSQLLKSPGETLGIFTLGHKIETRERQHQLCRRCNFCSLGSQWTGLIYFFIYIYSLVVTPDFDIFILKANLH